MPRMQAAKTRTNTYGGPQGTRHGVYKSGLEKKLAEDLSKLGVSAEYEPDTFPYQVEHKYTPDFKITKPDGKVLYIEAKGYFVSSDRSKLITVKEQHPELDIRLVFSRASNTLGKRSKTTYGKWAEQHGFPWAEKSIPKEWLT